MAKAGLAPRFTLATSAVAACSEVPRGYATRQQIVDVAALSAVTDFGPTKAGAAWAAWAACLPDNVAGAAKEDCIYNIMRSRDLLVTR